MPHYPSVNKKWDAEDPDHLGKREFIQAYNDDNFIEMQASIKRYQIEF